MSLIKLAGVVVLYNPEVEVLENIESYINDLDVLYAVDNSSNDNSYLFKNSKIRYIGNFENLGIATALNIGARKAIEENFEYLLTMDQDSKFDLDGLKKMKEFMIQDKDRTNVGIYSPFHKTPISETVSERVSSPLVIMTSGNIISLNIYQKIGGFKDWMFIDCVDFEYGLNLRNHGYDIKRLNYIPLWHNLGDYEIKYFFHKKIYCDNHSALRRYYIVRNSFYLFDMYSKNFPEYCNAVIKQVKQSFFYATVFEKQGLKKLKFMLKGYADYKKGIRGKII